MNNYTILPKTHDKALLAQYYSLADAFVICSKRENLFNSVFFGLEPFREQPSG